MAGSGDVGAGELLIKAACRLNALHASGPTSLMHAALRNRLDIARLLIANGAEVSCTAEHNNSALSLAREQGHAEMVQLLMSADT